MASSRTVLRGGRPFSVSAPVCGMLNHGPPAYSSPGPEPAKGAAGPGRTLGTGSAPSSVNAGGQEVGLYAAGTSPVPSGILDAEVSSAHRGGWAGFVAGVVGARGWQWASPKAQAHGPGMK